MTLFIYSMDLGKLILERLVLVFFKYFDPPYEVVFAILGSKNDVWYTVRAQLT